MSQNETLFCLKYSFVLSSVYIRSKVDFRAHFNTLKILLKNSDLSQNETFLQL